MRTPGNDRELAVGFLYGEGLIGSDVEVVPERERERAEMPGSGLQPCAGRTVEALRRLDVEANFFATSSCGVCGKATLDQVAVRVLRSRRGQWSRVRFSSACPTPFAKAKPCSIAREGCTPRVCSMKRADYSRCGKTWAGTTPSINWSAAPCWMGGCRFTIGFCWSRDEPASRSFKKRPWRVSRSCCTVSAPSSLAIAVADAGNHSRRLSARAELQRLHPSGTDRHASLMLPAGSPDIPRRPKSECPRSILHPSKRRRSTYGPITTPPPASARSRAP